MLQKRMVPVHVRPNIVIVFYSMILQPPFSLALFEGCIVHFVNPKIGTILIVTSVPILSVSFCVCPQRRNEICVEKRFAMDMVLTNVDCVPLMVNR